MYVGAEPENFQGMKLGHFDKFLKNPKDKPPHGKIFEFFSRYS